MDWWAGVNLCGQSASTTAELNLNPMDAAMFDPWIQCEDLDLNVILQQASTAAAASSTASPGSNSSSLSSSSACSPTSSSSTSNLASTSNNSATSKPSSRANSPRVAGSTSGAQASLIVGAQRRIQSDTSAALCSSGSAYVRSMNRVDPTARFFCPPHDQSSHLQPDMSQHHQHHHHQTNGALVDDKQSLFGTVAHGSSTFVHGHNRSSQVPSRHPNATQCSPPGVQLVPSGSGASVNRLGDQETLGPSHTSSPYAIQQPHINNNQCNLDTVLAGHVYHCPGQSCCSHNNSDSHCHANFIDSRDDNQIIQLSHNHNLHQLHHQQHHVPQQHQQQTLLSTHTEQLDLHQLHQNNLANSAGSSTATSDQQCNELNGGSRLIQDKCRLDDPKHELKALIESPEASLEMISSNDNNNSSNRSSPACLRKDLDGNNNIHQSVRSRGSIQTVLHQQSGSSSTTTSGPGNSIGAPQKTRRCRHITDYVLAEEEKRLLIKEGYSDFPMTCQSRPLSKTEERILRKIRRKIRNKKSAQCSRQRKKEYVEDLERKYAAVVRENGELKDIIERIQEQQQQQLQHQQQFQQSNSISNVAIEWRDLLVSTNKSQHQQPSNSVSIYN